MGNVYDFKTKQMIQDDETDLEQEEIETDDVSDDIDEDFDDNSDEEQENEEYVFPEALDRLRTKNYVFAGLSVIVILAFSITMRNWQLLAFLFASAWLVYRGYSLERRYKNGDIVELVVICNSVTKSAVRDQFTVGFRTDDEVPVFYQFKISGKKQADEFYPNGVYIIYYEKETPRILLTFQQI